MKILFKIFGMASIICICACNRTILPEENGLSKETAEESVKETEETKASPVRTYYSNLAKITQELLSYSHKTGCRKIYSTPILETGAFDKMNIQDAHGKKLKFSRLPLGEQISLANEICCYLADKTLEKMSLIQGLEDEYEILSSITEDIVEVVDDMIKGGDTVDDILYIFLDGIILKERVSEFAGKFKIADFGPGDGGSFASFDEYKSTMMSAGVKKGDLCIILPIFGSTALYNMTPEYIGDGDINYHSMGHSGTFTTDIKAETLVTDKVIFSAIEEGVMFESFEAWQCSQYVLRPHNLKFIWNPEREDETLEVEPLPFTDDQIDAYIKALKSNEAEGNFIDDIWLNWLFCKWLTPKEFCCSSLIWWSARKAYDIDLSIPFMPYTAPLDIVASPYTEILAAIDVSDQEED